MELLALSCEWPHGNYIGPKLFQYIQLERHNIDKILTLFKNYPNLKLPNAMLGNDSGHRSIFHQYYCPIPLNKIMTKVITDKGFITLFTSVFGINYHSYDFVDMILGIKLSNNVNQYTPKLIQVPEDKSFFVTLTKGQDNKGPGVIDHRILSYKQFTDLIGKLRDDGQIDYSFSDDLDTVGVPYSQLTLSFCTDSSIIEKLRKYFPTGVDYEQDSYNPGDDRWTIPIFDELFTPNWIRDTFIIGNDDLIRTILNSNGDYYSKEEEEEEEEEEVILPRISA